MIIIPLIGIAYCFSVYWCLWYDANSLVLANKRDFYKSELDLLAMSTFIPIINVIAAIRYRMFINEKV